MKIVICPDSFKGCMSASQAAAAIERGCLRAIPEAEIIKVPLADGGEGTVEAIIEATGGEFREMIVKNPLMQDITATYGVLPGGDIAVIEMASASGLCLLSVNQRNPLVTSTYGVGQLLMAAVNAGVKKIIIGIGGSATNDGGVGAMSAMGARFLDANGDEIGQGGAALAQLCKIDITGFLFPKDRVEVEVACDVTNPLCGSTGASAVFGPQKGATPEMVAVLDQALRNYAGIIERDLGVCIENMPGSGAAGGLGGGLAAFLNAKMRSGIDMVLDTVSFDTVIRDADLIITGEGKLDEQTAYGKTIAGVLKRSSTRKVPVIALAGSVSGSLDELYKLGLTAALSIINSPMTLEAAMASGSSLLEEAAMNVTRIVTR